MLADVPSARAAAVGAGLREQVDSALRDPLHVDGRSFWVAASAGVAVARAGDGVEQVVHRADQAMYHDKRLRWTSRAAVPGPREGLALGGPARP